MSILLHVFSVYTCACRVHMGCEWHVYMCMYLYGYEPKNIKCLPLLLSDYFLTLLIFT